MNFPAIQIIMLSKFYKSTPTNCTFQLKTSIINTPYFILTPRGFSRNETIAKHVVRHFRATENRKRIMKMKPEHKVLYNQIDEILWQDWDPIGINDEKQIREEYYGYIPQVFNLKIQGADKNKIVDYLYEMETINMETNGNMQNCEFVAEKIINL